MNLPIEVIPNTVPRQFRWRQMVDTPFGPRVQVCEGMIGASTESALVELITLARSLDEKAQALLKFKQWVHAYLDEQGVPTQFPEGKHSKEGCRIGDRLDYLVDSLDEKAQREIARLQKMVESLSERVASQSELLEKRAESDKPDSESPKQVAPSSQGKGGRR